jgi:2-pyrone-4,6-dicarboxylate lactonase
VPDTTTSQGFALPAGTVDSHVHVFDPARFAYQASRRYTPGPATVDQLIALHDRLGVGRAVLVQPSVYGCDNSCLLDALGRLGPRARGVAVIDPAASKSELEDLIAAGVCGVRLNIQVDGLQDSAQLGRLLENTDRQLQGTPLLLQVFASAAVLSACSAQLASMGRPVLIDHFGLLKGGMPVDASGRPPLQALLAAPNVHIKLSGPHQISQQGPDYPDVTAVAKWLTDAAPGRVVWGSDWPHTGGVRRDPKMSPGAVEPFRLVDDAHELGLVRRWVPDAFQRAQILALTPARLFGFSAPASP